MSELVADRYRLERSLGAGGMSTVRLAFDTRLERHVAVKLLAEHLAHDSGFVARFRREALSAARLIHPNVVQVYDFGLDAATGRQYIVMEHVDGESVAELLRDRGALDPRRAVDILTQACRGLDYAHRHGVIHRDVKPGNLLVNREGQVKLADFGIAKAAEQSDITKVGSVLGTAAYLSPEQTRGEPAGPASDLYALGVVAYQTLTGRLPYDGKSLPALARQQEAGLPVSPDLVTPAVAPPLAAAVLRALAARPQRRYASATEMEVALRDGLRGLPSSHTTVTTAALPGQDAARTSSADVTRRLDDDPTRIAGHTAATTARLPPPPTRRREPLRPLAEEPRRPPALEAPVRPRRSSRRERRREANLVRRQAAPPAPLPAAPDVPRAAPKPRRGFFRTLWRLLVLACLLALIVGGVILYQAFQQSTAQSRQLGRDLAGSVLEQAQEIRRIVEDNLP